jgi:hypothetical protein
MHRITPGYNVLQCRTLTARRGGSWPREDTSGLPGLIGKTVNPIWMMVIQPDAGGAVPAQSFNNTSTMGILHVKSSVDSVKNNLL